MKNGKKRTFCFVGLILIAGCLVFVSCGDDEAEAPGTGAIGFYANGEDFVRDGFTSMDDWALEFTHLYINLSTPTAYQGIEAAEEEKKATGEVESKHGGHPHGNIPEDAPHASLPGMYFVDLAQGDAATLVGTVDGVELGNYNYANFDVVVFNPYDEDQVILPNLNPAELDDYVGYSIIMIGTADNGQDSIPFTIKLDDQMEYSSCGPWDDGIVEAGGSGTAEMTFHFDHVFGDADELPGEGVNLIALGFNPLADLWDGVEPLVLNQTLMGLEMSGADFLTFIDALRTIGHSGEGHCAYEKIW